jgi:DNA-binding response OmpR family regulator
MGAVSFTVGRRILVVDDNRDICDFMHAALKAAGYEVQTAEDGAAALVLQRSRSADLLITDIFMPGQEGFETISCFKSEFPQTRIIVMSAGNVPGMPHDFLAGVELLGVGAALRKPFTADLLLDTVRQVLQA